MPWHQNLLQLHLLLLQLNQKSLQYRPILLMKQKQDHRKHMSCHVSELQRGSFWATQSSHLPKDRREETRSKSINDHFLLNHMANDEDDIKVLPKRIACSGSNWLSTMVSSQEKTRHREWTGRQQTATSVDEGSCNRKDCWAAHPLSFSLSGWESSSGAKNVETLQLRNLDLIHYSIKTFNSLPHCFWQNHLLRISQSIFQFKCTGEMYCNWLVYFFLRISLVYLIPRPPTQQYKQIQPEKFEKLDISLIGSFVYVGLGVKA